MRTIVGLYRKSKITLIIEEDSLCVYHRGANTFPWSKRDVFPIHLTNDVYEIRLNIIQNKHLLHFPILEIGERKHVRFDHINGVWRGLERYYLQISIVEFEKLFLK